MSSRVVGSRNNTTAAPPETQEQGSLCVSPTAWNPSPAVAALTGLSFGTVPGQKAPDSTFTVFETGHLKNNNLMLNNFFMCICVRVCVEVKGGPPSLYISFVKTGSLTGLTRLAGQKPPGTLLYPLQHHDCRSSDCRSSDVLRAPSYTHEDCVAEPSSSCMRIPTGWVGTQLLAHAHPK